MPLLHYHLRRQDASLISSLMAADIRWTPARLAKRLWGTNKIRGAWPLKQLKHQHGAVEKILTNQSCWLLLDFVTEYIDYKLENFDTNFPCLKSGLEMPFLGSWRGFPKGFHKFLDWEMLGSWFHAQLQILLKLRENSMPFGSTFTHNSSLWRFRQLGLAAVLPKFGA